MANEMNNTVVNAESEERVSKNFIEQIIDKDIEEGTCKKVITRFPPEPNGYLHIGHAKSILLNAGLAKKYGGTFHLRFDDTNPTKEKTEFVESIKKDVEWIGGEYGDNLFFASEYFDAMYEAAVKLIKKGKAYVCDLSAAEIREYRGTLTEPGKNSPYRDRSIEENLELFEAMKDGKFKDGEKVEMVYIPAEDRGTLCISSQIGCAMNCRFCNTGYHGFVRNMTVEEIVSQVLIARDELGEWQNLNNKIGEGRLISNIVVMGMGEPLVNYDNMVKALKIINDPDGIAFSNRRITLSTCGLVPQIKKLGDDVKVNISLKNRTMNLRIAPYGVVWLKL